MSKALNVLLLLLLGAGIVAAVINPGTQRQHAEQVCSKFVVGSMYDPKVLLGVTNKKAHVESDGHIDYFFSIFFESFAECRILLDSKQIIIKKEVIEK